MQSLRSNNAGPKKYWAQKEFWAKQILGPKKILGLEKKLSIIIGATKKFESFSL